MKSRLLATAAIAAAFCGAVEARAQTWSLEASLAHLDEKTGAELAAGYALEAGSFRLTPSLGVFVYQGEGDDRYREETFSGGQTVCRDTTNGQFADKVNCDDTELAAFGRLEASYAFGWGELGIGGRFDEDRSRGYARVSRRFSETGAVHLTGGEDYLAIGFVFRGR